MAHELIDPKEVVIKGRGDKETTFIISCVPYLAGGRELCTQYPLSALPKIGNYEANEKLAKLLWKYVEIVTPSGTRIRLETSQLIDNHVPDVVTGLKLEAAMLEHNLGFSVPEKISTFLESMSAAIEPLISQIWTGLQAQSSQQAHPPKTN